MKLFSISTIVSTIFHFSAFFPNGNTESIAINPLKEISQRFFKDFALEFSKTNQSMTSCIVDLLHWHNAILKRDSWSLQMLDSWGKIPIGIFNGNLYNLGNYDECINSFELEQRKIKGKYCLVELPFDLKSINNSDLFDYEALNLDDIETSFTLTLPKRKERLWVYTSGICVPHSCKSVEIENILQIILKIQNFTDVTVIVDQDYCVTNDPLVWRTIDWIAFGIFLFIGILMLLSSLYEFYINYFHMKNNSDRLYKLLTSFSIITNTSKVISIGKSSHNLKNLNGLRSISILWIIIYHRYIFEKMHPTKNFFDLTGKNMNAVISSTHLSVDTFFVMGGFLLSFIQLKKTCTAKNFNVLSFYIHRIIRLTPSLAAVLFFYVTFFKYIGDGPVWNKMAQIFVSHCEQKWLSTLLYIQNYQSLSNICLPQVWYLCVDMHLYILSPILIYAFLRSKKMGWINIIMWMSVLQIALFLIVFQNKWNAGQLVIKSVSHRMRDFYVPTHTRALPWLIGFCLGCLLTGKSKIDIKIKKLTLLGIWISCLTIIISLIYVMKPLQDENREVTHLIDTTYNTFARTIWSLCISWIIAACYFGYGGLIDKFLSLSIWEIIGKLSYCMYLTHTLVITKSTSSIRNPIYWSNFGSFKSSIYDIILTIFVSYILTVSIELPFSNLEQILFPKKKPETDANQVELDKS